MTDGAGQRLNSWKEIADHVQRDVRTVRRWERERGMPVHRVPGGGSATVFAFTGEIDQWLAGDATRARPNAEPVDRPVLERTWGGRRITIVGILAAVGLVALLVLLIAPRGLNRIRPVERLVIKDRQIRALDDRGGLRWQYQLPALVQNDVHPQSVFVGPPDASDDQLLVVAADIEDGQHGIEASLVAFHADGRLRWQLTPHDRLRFVGGEYGPSWTGGDSSVVAFSVGGQQRLAWSLHHFTWWPGRVLFVDDSGRVRNEFVNSGWISRVVPSSDGRFLLALGVSNSADAAITAVLDIHDPSGTSPEVSRSPYACLNCPAGHPIRYIVFPRSSLSRRTEFRLQGPAVFPVDNGVQIRVVEGVGTPVPETIYDFSPGFQFLRASRSDGYRDALIRLETTRPRAGDAAGTHRADMDVPAVRVWRAETGWVTEQQSSSATNARRPPLATE